MDTTYESDTIWRDMQRFLPEENRLDDALMPEEYFIRTVGGWEIHIDRYRPLPADERLWKSADAGDSAADAVSGEDTADAPDPRDENAVGGTELAPETEPKARIVALHGMAGNGRLLSFIAGPLARAGYEVICPDLPLYGLTRFDGDVFYPDWVDVGETVVRHFADDHVPLFLLGMGTGGLLAYQVADRCNRIAREEGLSELAVAGVITTALLDQRDDRVTRATAANPLLGTIAKPALEGLGSELGWLPMPVMFLGNIWDVANDRDFVRLLIGDMRSGAALVPAGFIRSLLKADLETEPEDFRACPVMVCHPTRDRWSRPGLTKRFYDRLGGAKIWIDLEGAGHYPIEPLGLAEWEAACIAFMECYR